MRTLEKLNDQEFQIHQGQKLALGRLNVFIGGNGAGKSNLIEVFHFLREIVNQHLGDYVGTKGGADTLLHFGRRNSPEMSFRLEFGEGDTGKWLFRAVTKYERGQPDNWFREGHFIMNANIIPSRTPPSGFVQFEGVKTETN